MILHAFDVDAELKNDNSPLAREVIRMVRMFKETKSVADLEAADRTRLQGFRRLLL